MADQLPCAPALAPMSVPASANAPVLVLGVGNILLRDEGVGVRVVEELQRLGTPDSVELCDGATAGLDLLDVLAERRRVIVVDAMAANQEPGTVLRFGSTDLDEGGLPPTQTGPHSAHELGLAEALTVARQLGIAPGELVLYGVEPKEIDYGLELSPEIAAIVPALARQVLSEATAPTSREERPS